MARDESRGKMVERRKIKRKEEEEKYVAQEG